MIQRIQTIYLLIVLILASVGVYLHFDEFNDFIVSKNFDNIYILSLFASVVVVSIWTIFMYSNRKLQFVLDRLNILINLILLGIFGYYAQTLSGETIIVSEKEIELIIPLVSIVFLYLANKAIQKDEELVKSVDRLR